MFAREFGTPAFGVTDACRLELHEVIYMAVEKTHGCSFEIPSPLGLIGCLFFGSLGHVPCDNSPTYEKHWKKECGMGEVESSIWSSPIIALGDCCYCLARLACSACLACFPCFPLLHCFLAFLPLLACSPACLPMGAHGWVSCAGPWKPIWAMWLH